MQTANGYGASPAERVLTALAARSGPKPRRSSGGNWSARCPAHADQNASLSVRSGDDGRALVNCHAGCGAESIAQALGMSPADLFVERDRAEATPHKQESCTLPDLARVKCLPVDVLSGFGWRDGPRGVEIPYVRPDGTLYRTRLRTALSAKDGSRWADDGEGQIAYQPDGGAIARASRELVLVEGETDTVTLLAAGIGALGVPGATAAKFIVAHHIEGIERVWVVRETDAAGARFADELVPARLAQLGFKGQITALIMPDGAKDPNALWCRNPDREVFSQLFREVMAKSARKRRTSPADYVEALRPQGERLQTGFAALDEATRGGIAVGKLIIVAGAPGAAKTSATAQWMHQWELAGATVCWLAADEPPEGVAMRLGQQMGFSRAGLEDPDSIGDNTRAEFRRRVDGRRIVLLDPDEADTTIESAAEMLLARAGTTPPVLVVDSIQTARCAAACEMTTAREVMDAKVSVIKAVARKGVLVVAISEMSRAGYRGGADGNISALAASKESGSIEYGAALLLGLRSVKGEVGQVDVEVAKNRLGPGKPTFRLIIDFERASMIETARPDSDSGATGRAANLAKVEADAKDLIAVVLECPGISERDLRAALRAAGMSWGRDRLDAAKARLQAGVAGHHLENRGNNRTSKWFVTAAPGATE